MEAAEGETGEPIAIIRIVDVGGVEAQAVYVRRVSRISQAAPAIGTDAGVAQSTEVRMSETTTYFPQRRKNSGHPAFFYSYLRPMEAAEGETAEPTVVIGGVDDGGIEVQAVGVRRISRVSRARPGVGMDAGAVQSTVGRKGAASTGEPQRRKRNGTNRCALVAVFRLL